MSASNVQSSGGDLEEAENETKMQGSVQASGGIEKIEEEEYVIRATKSEILSTAPFQHEAEENSHAFMIGVLNYSLVIYLFGAYPLLLPYFYTAKIVTLVAYRAYVYYPRSWHWFLFDYCYTVNIFWLIYLWVFPNKYIFVIAYSLSFTLGVAVMIFGNSLLFHSIDHTTSVLIHLTPNMVAYALRWKHSNFDHAMDDKWEICQTDDSDCFNAWYFFLWPLIYIVAFNFQYYFWIQIVFRSIIERDPNAYTTYKWLMRKKTGKLWECMGSLGHSNRVYVWGIFSITSNFIFCSPAILVYLSEYANLAWIVLIGIVVIRNGGITYGKVLAKSNMLDLYKWTAQTPKNSVDSSA